MKEWWQTGGFSQSKQRNIALPGQSLWSPVIFMHVVPDGAQEFTLPWEGLEATAMVQVMDLSTHYRPW